MNIYRLFVKSEQHKRWFQILDWVFGLSSFAAGVYYGSAFWIGVGLFSIIVAALQPLTYVYKKISFIKPAQKEVNSPLLKARELSDQPRREPGNTL